MNRLSLSRKNSRRTKSRNIRRRTRSIRKIQKMKGRRKTRQVKKSLRRRQRGGTAPVDANNKAPCSVFTDDMNQRTFGCRQPNWGPKCT
mgnify:CR=1 FL=1